MANLWTKKNPLLSMWLSGANALGGKARAAGTAQAKRQQINVVKQATRYWRDAWSSAKLPKRPR